MSARAAEMLKVEIEKNRSVVSDKAKKAAGEAACRRGLHKLSDENSSEYWAFILGWLARDGEA